MCALRGGERGEKKSGVLIGVKNHTTGRCHRAVGSQNHAYSANLEPSQILAFFEIFMFCLEPMFFFSPMGSDLLTKHSILAPSFDLIRKA